MSTEEKKTWVTPYQIVAWGSQATADEVDHDIDAQVIIFIIDQLRLIHTNAR